MKRSQFKPMLLLVALLTALTGVSAVFAAGSVSPTCPGSLETRLSVGDDGMVARSYSTLRDAPAGNPIAIKTYGSMFTVIGDAVCASNNLFYVQIDYGGGQVGWANESQVVSEYGSQYWLEPSSDATPTTPAPTTPAPTTPAPTTPAPPTPLPTTEPPCAASLDPRLEVGDEGVVARAFSTLRDAPAGNPIGIYLFDSRFEVLEGPICAGYGPLTWYKIRYLDDGKEGWASESQRRSIYGSNLYWLEEAMEG